MNIKIVSGLAGVVAVAAMLLPASAFAASVTNPNAIFDGQSQVYGNAGSSAEATFQVDVPAGQVLHAIRTKVDGQATVCTPLGAIEGAQTTDVTVNITLPPNTNNGGYTLVADLYYTDTLPQAQAMTGNLACTSSASGSHVNLNAYNGGTVVNVLPTSGNNTDNGNGSSNDTAIQAILAWIQSQMHPTTPAPTSACSEYANLSSGLSVGSDTRQGGRVGQLQSFLMYKGFNIPLLSSNQAPYGYYGNQTSAAASGFVAANHCN